MTNLGQIENLASKKSTGECLFYHNDHLGGVNVITNSSGLMAQIIEYDPWGKVSREEGIGDSVRRFTGKQLDQESGLYYYGARYYDAELGRFISPDSIVPYPFDPQSLNRYSYVGNNPVNAIDPDGNFHIHKKKKKKGGFFRRFFGFFMIVVGILTLQPEIAGEGGALLGFAAIGRGISDLASGNGGLGGGISPPGGVGGSGFELAAVNFAGNFFSPALAMAGCDFCSDSRLDLLRTLLGLFRAAEAQAADDDDDLMLRPRLYQPGIATSNSLIRYTRKLFNPSRGDIQHLLSSSAHRQGLGSQWAVHGPVNNETIAQMEQALRVHVNDPGTQVIVGTAGGQKLPAVHFYDPITRRVVSMNPATGGLQSPTGFIVSEKQRIDLINTGHLGLR